MEDELPTAGSFLPKVDHFGQRTDTAGSKVDLEGEIGLGEAWRLGNTDQPVNWLAILFCCSLLETAILDEVDISRLGQPQASTE